MGISYAKRSDRGILWVEDLGIRRGMETAYGIEDRGAMEEKATEWAPFRSYASRYLWRVHD